MSEKIKISLTPKEKEILKSFVNRRIKAYLGSHDKKGANKWRKIIKDLDNGHLTKKEIIEILTDISIVMSKVWCPEEEYDEAFNHYFIAKKLGKYIK